MLKPKVKSNLETCVGSGDWKFEVQLMAQGILLLSDLTDAVTRLANSIEELQESDKATIPPAGD